jgi:serine/threonine-protein kinase
MAYMSPEQAQGQAVDQRTDLWSLGVILYEMVTRRLPFEGEHDAAITYAIVNETPHPLARYSADAPEELQRVVSKCLNKNREERYQSASDLVADLRALRRFSSASGVPLAKPPRKHSRLIATMAVLGIAVIAIGAALVTDLFKSDEGVVSPARAMLAVLPFENLGAEDQEYFADGVTEEIIARLAGVSAIGVISRQSSMQYKGTAKPLGEIGDELGVDYILEGTIRWDRSGRTDRVRITPQLIHVEDDTHLWADVFDEDLTEVFQVQTDIAEKVVAALNVSLFEPERRSLESRPTDNLEAYDHYLQGNEVFDPAAIEDDKALLLAAQFYRKAIAADSNFAEAHAKLSRALLELYWHHGRPPALREQAQAALDRARMLDPDAPIALISLGSFYYHDGDYDRALEEFARAERARPNDAELQSEIGYAQWRQGQFDQSRASFHRAAELDPQSGTPFYRIAECYHIARRYDSAIAYYDRAISIAPELSGPYSGKAWTYMMRDGDIAAARSVLEEASKYVHWTGSQSYYRATIYACAADYERAHEEFALTDMFSSDRNAHRAAIYGIQGDSNREHLYYDSARINLEAKLASGEDDPELHSALGLAYAGLGREEEAIREGESAVRLAPFADDAFFNLWHLIRLARIYVMTGDYDKAIDQLEVLLSVPSYTSTATIRVNPIWAPLRDHPRFEALLEQGDKIF